MPTALLRSRLYRCALACSVPLVLYVVARAPLWSSVMAGARVQLGPDQLALVPAAWQCSERPHTCSTVVGGKQLVAQVGAFIERPITCTASFDRKPVACAVRLWYAPRLKPFLEIGSLPNVSLEQAILERPWRLLDQGLLGEEGPLPMWTGVACSLLLAVQFCAWFRRRGLWRIARVGLAACVFGLLNMVWLLQCLLLGYID